MRLSTDQIPSDEKIMTNYICERIPSECRIILAAGEDGATWADLSAFWDESTGWHLLMEKSDEHVTLEEVYDHFRRKEMTRREWHQWFAYATRCPSESQARNEVAEPCRLPSSFVPEIEAKLDRLHDIIGTLLRQQSETASPTGSGEVITLTKKEVARRFQISTRTVDRWRSMGIDLGEINVNGTPRFSPEKIAAIISTQKVKRRRRNR